MLVWFNGELLNEEEIKISIFTHALHYGTSVFEGIRAYKTRFGTAIFRLKEHIDRFFYSMQQLRMKSVFSKESIIKACIEVVRENGLEECYIRPLAFYGEGGLGLNPLKNKVNIAILAFPFNYLRKEIKVKTSSFKRLSNLSFNVNAKIGGHYINSVNAHLEAVEFGFDEALLLDENNYITEGSGENIFFVKNKKIYTPSLGRILAGITRDSVIKILKDNGYEIIEKNIHYSEIEYFDEAFFTGTAIEVARISQIDNKVFEEREIFEFLNEKFNEIKRGFDKKYLNWLTFVDEEVEKRKNEILIE
ncbi:MAG TPA: branched-chain amino acid transaminase [Nautiliaceae bacterium]|nr:branched-chain amino acid transaminase [Nautiliaceae bacterium]